MNRILVFAARILVSATFLFSGFVKLVDPLGSAYKFEEYFGSDVLNLPFLIPYALPFSMGLILVEILLGVTLLVGYKPKLTLGALLGMTVLFLFLTWYSAYFDKVTDCGCFGDALKLSPWETFYKNGVLLFLLLFLSFRISYVIPIFSDDLLRWITLCFLGVFVYILYHVQVHLPLFDFRAYAVGKNLKEGMLSQPGSDALPPVHDFYLESETADLTDFILAAEKCLLFVSYNIQKGDFVGFSEVAQLAQEAKERGYLVYGLSASGSAELQALQKEFEFPFEFLFCDETTLKTIIRANPGIVSLERGTVVGKWNWRDADAVFQD